MRSEDLRRSGRRLRVAGAVLLLAYLGLAARAAQLAVDPRAIARGHSQTGTVIQLAPARGLVTDRHGTELAITVPAPSVYAVPRDVRDADAAARALAPVLGLDRDPLRDRLAADRGFVFVRRWITDAQAEAIEALDLEGVGLVFEPRRVYPQLGLAGRTLGFANIDGEGARGLEQAEDGWLRGERQRIAIERDARGRLLAKAGYDPRSAAGGDVALTIDAAVQSEVEAALQEVVGATGADGGLVVMMDPRTADVVAAAEWPPFDPNRFRTTPYPQTRSRIFLDAMEPGSSLKPVVVAAALERRAIGPRQPFDCEKGTWRVPGKTLRDTKPHELLDAGGMLRVSSNICAAKIGYQVGAAAHYDMLRALGFGRRTGSGFPDESAGLLRHFDGWQPVDHATISFGQGINVTAIQLAAAVSTIAGDGQWRAPRLVLARREPGQDWRSAPRTESRRVIGEGVASELRRMMTTVVRDEGGTGSYAALKATPVAGKTGTAQKLEADGTYSSNRYLAWFVGMAPADDPDLVAVVMIDEPKGFLNSGGATAAPVFARAMASGLARGGLITEPIKEMHHLALAGSRERLVAERKARRAEQQRAQLELQTARSLELQTARSFAARNRPAEATARPRRALPELQRLGDRIFLPDLTDLTEAQVAKLTRGLPIQLVMRGSGFAVSQEPPAGSVVAGGPLHVRFAAPGDG